MDTILFDPTVEKLQSIIAATSQITASDLSDDAQLAIVKENRIQLRDARITIEKQGKSMREEALKYQKDVIAREKELIAIIEPEEIRLKSLEDEAKLIKERAARRELFPMRREQLGDLLDDSSWPEDDFLLDMDNDEFITYLNGLKAKRLDRDTAELKAREAAIADKERLAQVAEAARVAERNRIEAAAKADEECRVQAEAQRKYDAERAAQKLIDDAKLEADRLVAAAKAQEEARMRESEAHAQQAKDKQAKLEKQKKYKAWLEKIGYTETEHGSWYFDTKDDMTNAYRLISSFKGT